MVLGRWPNGVQHLLIKHQELSLDPHNWQNNWAWLCVLESSSEGTETNHQPS